MTTTLRLAAAAAAVALLATCTPTAATADTTPTTPAAPLVVMSLNVHGSVDRFGHGNKGAPAAVTADVVRLVRVHAPDAVTLQEVCGRQQRDLVAKLKRYGYRGTMTYTRRSAGCNDKAHGNRFGNAVFVKGKIGWRRSWALPWTDNGGTGTEPRRLLCVRPSGVSWRVCSVHLGGDESDRARQAAKVIGVVGRWGASVVVAGDLNLRPAAAAVAFPGWLLAGERIDHLVSRSAVAVTATELVPSSDHKALIGTAAVKR